MRSPLFKSSDITTINPTSCGVIIDPYYLAVMIKSALTLLLAIGIFCCDAVQQQGTVVKVIDGDTFDVLDGGVRTRIRMFGIDAPERGQPFNRKSREFASSLIADRHVKIVPHEKDRWGRTVADVYLEDGTYVNAKMVASGYAWHFTRYSNDETVAKLERDARSRRLGLWTEDAAVAPWEYRKRSQKRSTENL